MPQTTLRRRESALQVAITLLRRQAGLWRRRRRPAAGIVENRHADAARQRPRQLVGLVEAALGEPRGMERHRDDRVRTAVAAVVGQ
jgi:hypothetical protein